MRKPNCLANRPRARARTRVEAPAAPVVTVSFTPRFSGVFAHARTRQTGSTVSITCSKLPGASGFTWTDLIVTVAVIAVLAVLLSAALPNARERARRSRCSSNLKITGFGFKTWSLDRANAFPMQFPAGKGGTRELIESGPAFVHFQVLSNELAGVTQTLLCPADKRRPAKDFASLSNSNVSYFVGLEAVESNPQMLLAGDRNLTNGTPLPPNRILVLTPKSVLGWTDELHHRQGNILLADGSVQQISSSRLTAQAANSGGTNRLAMP
jgi:hypothetical protein